MSAKSTNGSDLQGITHLIKDATLGVVDIVEVMHHRALHHPFVPKTPIQRMISSITSFTYKNIRRSTLFVAWGLDKIFGNVVPANRATQSTNELEALKSVLNGVIGDYLHEKGNPLEIPMQFRYQSQPIPLHPDEIKRIYPNPGSKILIMVHGLCMNDIQWTRKGHNHGETLAVELDMTPVYLHYNSGLHISENGKTFSALLEELIMHWPVPIDEITFLCHSMGGLVSRSALHYGQQQQKNWTKYLTNIVFLSTPHHGAPLERIGNYVHVTLDTIPHTRPFARLGKIRSTGITDLRYGNLTDEDWSNVETFELHRDQRQHIPLPE